MKKKNEAGKGNSKVRVKIKDKDGCKRKSNACSSSLPTNKKFTAGFLIVYVRACTDSPTTFPPCFEEVRSFRFLFTDLKGQKI